MESTAPKRRSAIVSLAMGLLGVGFILAGAACPPPTPTPPPEAVLAGDWDATTGENIYLVVTFNDDGVVVTIKGTLEDGTVATLTVPDATTTLDGNNVTIRIPRDNGEVSFDAVLSDDQNSMTGSVTREIVIDEVLQVVIPQGDLTLNRILEPECAVDADCAAGETCVDGQCVAGPTGCTSDDDCDAGTFCDTQTGECEPEAIECDPPCGEGEVCNPDTGECEPEAVECDPPCGEGEVCNLETGECEPEAIECDPPCGEGEFCDTQTGECVVNENLYATIAFDTDFDRVHPLHTDCMGCHHTGIPSPGEGSCRTCHSDDPNVPNSFKEIAHDMNESGDGCRSCHAAEFTDNCAYCHTALSD